MTPYNKLLEGAESLRDALGALHDSLLTVEISTEQARRLLPFFHDTAEIAFATTAGLQRLLYEPPYDQEDSDARTFTAALAAGKIQCAAHDEAGIACPSPAVGLNDENHPVCEKHGVVFRPPPAARRPPPPPAPPAANPPQTDAPPG